MTARERPAPAAPGGGAAARFITFEGGERAGKTTQARLLWERLRERGIPALFLREPGSTPLGEALRHILLSGEYDMAPRTEALLMAAARAEMVATVLEPALAAGTWVICDRYADSSLAYQGGGLELGLEAIRRLNDWATGGRWPDLTFLFDADPAAARRRRDGEGDRIERRAAGFHERVREAYLQLAAAEPRRFVVIDAALPQEVIAERVWTAVARLIEGRTPA
ncbi:MAG: dTMP kinase [Firmicutes bacterium]|nr:dTMP kinase [Bacillota bacterium]